MLNLKQMHVKQVFTQSLSEEVADEIVNTGDEDVEFDDVNLEESNLTTAELAAETDEETEEDKNTEE